MNLKQIVEGTDTRLGKSFDLFTQGLIALSVVSFSIETLPDLSETTREVLHMIEVATVAIFTIEYLLRLAVADNRIQFVFSLYGLIDLLAILPFYLHTVVDLRSLRVIRFIRIIRIFKLARYNRAALRFRRVFTDIKEELILFLAVSAILLYVSSVGIYYFEHQSQPEQFASVFHAMWWSLTTLTTVGYGDVYPLTVGGRVFTAFILFLSLGLVAVPSGLVAAALSRIIRDEDDAQR